MPHRTSLRCLRYLHCLFLCFVCQIGQAELITLYDGNGLPGNQLWLGFAANGLSFTQSTVATGVRLQTDSPVSAGYSNYTPFGQLKNSLFPTLNRTDGFELSFSLSVAGETHSSNDRAGFSVTLLGNDSRGIELAFWENEVWAQESSPLFRHGEGSNLNTAIQRDYRLRVQNETYALFSGSAPLLTGAVRDYTAFAAVPYVLPNFVFLGDNTSSGAANVTLGAVSLESNLASVPEPSSYAFVVAMVAIFIFKAILVRLGRRQSRVQLARTRTPLPKRIPFRFSYPRASSPSR